MDTSSASGSTPRLPTRSPSQTSTAVPDIPVRHEMSPHEAAEWGPAISSVPEHERLALYSWVASGDYIAEDTGESPSLSDFEERYAGHWDSFREYAENLAEVEQRPGGAGVVLQLGVVVTRPCCSTSHPRWCPRRPRW